jgi:hypothetical protein
MPTKRICSFRWTDGRPIKRRAVVSAKKLVMVVCGLNTGDWLFAEVKESLTILESPYTPPFSNSSSSLGTYQGVQGPIALPKTALQTQGHLQPGRNKGRRNEGRRNEGRRNEACRNKACQSEGCQSGADQNKGRQNRTQLTIDQDGQFGKARYLEDEVGRF